MNEVLRLIGMLAVTVGILILAYFCTRLIGQWGIRSGQAQTGERQLQVLEQLAVGRDQKLMVVQVHDRFLLLGVTGSNISTLAELSAEEAACWTQAKSAGNPPPSFLEAVRSTIHKNNK